MAVGLPERIATHEAAHVCIALVFAIPLVRVTVIGQPVAQCARYHPPPGLGIEALLTFYLAGSEPEREYFGASDDDGGRGDVDNARAELARLFAPSQIGYQLQRYRESARRLVSSAWAQQRIRLLAAALLRHGTLSGEQVFGFSEVSA